MITTVLGPGAIAISTAAPANASRLSTIRPCSPRPAPPRNGVTARPRSHPHSGAPSSPPVPDGDGDGPGEDGPGDVGAGDGEGDGDDGDDGCDGCGNDGVGSGGGGGGSFTTGWHANSTAISSASTSSAAANPTVAATRFRSGGRSPTGPAPATGGSGRRGPSNAGSPDPSQYGWNCGPRRRPPHHDRPDPWNTTGSKNRSAPTRSASYSVATHGAGPSGCAATTGAAARPPPGPPPAPGASTGPRPGTPPAAGTAALIAARNRSRAAASPAAPRFSTATLARRPSPSTPRNTIPAADSDKRADRRNGPN